MNLLAHIFLSGEPSDLMLGNFIGDFVKGKQWQNYPIDMQKGILLHRRIDDFTDKHEVVKEGIKRLRPDYGLYAGVIIDIFYDHFLALNWKKYTENDLENYAQDVFLYFSTNVDKLPAKVQSFIPYMIRDNWLVKYGTSEGIYHSLRGVTRRIQHRKILYDAIQFLESDFDLLNEEFQIFFPDLIQLVKNEQEKFKNFQP